MPARLTSKPCKFCGVELFGKKRADRKAYYYPKRCDNCARKALDPKVLAIRQQQIARLHEIITRPVGSKQLHKARDGLYYVRIKTAMPDVWEYEHRFVTKAPKGMHVHHINGDTLDNRPENLTVLSHRDHQILHQTITQWSRLFTECQACGTVKKKHLSKGLCTTCYQRKPKV